MVYANKSLGCRSSEVFTLQLGFSMYEFSNTNLRVNIAPFVETRFQQVIET